MSLSLTAGEVISTSAKPLVHIVCNEYMDQFCSNCNKRSNELKMCSKCLHIYYCDQNCQTNDWKYHKNECKVFSHKDFNINVCKWRERLLLRLWLTIKSDHMFATRRHLLYDGSDVCLNDLKVDVINVLKNDVFVNERFHEFMIICNHFTVYGLDFDYKELLRWFAFISNSMNIIIQMISISITNCPNMYEYVDVGLYIELSFLSHSCLPNCAVVDGTGLSLEVRAMKSIPIGEPLTVSAVDLMQKRSEIRVQLRQKCIECQCLRCEQNIDLRIEDLFVINRYQRLLHSSQSFFSDNTFNEYLEIVPKVLAIAEEVLGTHSVVKTTILYNRLRLMYDHGHRRNKDQCLNQFIANLCVTHGENHVLKDILFHYNGFTCFVDNISKQLKRFAI